MKSFRFPLQRVLDWRGMLMRVEEEKLAGLQYKLASLIKQEQELMAEQARSAGCLLGSTLISGSDILALAAFQARIQRGIASLKASQAQCQVQMAEQRKQVLKARKDCRVLEKLKEKRLKAWTYLSDREVEDTASENYISQWVRSSLEA
jgi:flagellar export protein FliJ